MYRINYQSENATSGYNEYAYHRPSSFAAGRMNGGTVMAYGDDLAFRIWGSGSTEAIGGYPVTEPTFSNFRFKKYSGIRYPYFQFDFGSDLHLVYIFYYSYDLENWYPITSNGSYNKLGTGSEITQSIYTSGKAIQFIRADVVNVADTRFKKP